MKLIPQPIEGVYAIELKNYRDTRGFFVERFHEENFKKLGLPIHFSQDNHSRSLPGVLRGLHYQMDPPQAKLVGVLRGRIWDVAVDMRKNSSTYGQHVALELSDENNLLLFIPAGLAHGFYVLGEDAADVSYKVTGQYNPKTEFGIRWNDPELNIPWPTKKPILSLRDAALPFLGKL